MVYGRVRLTGSDLEKRSVRAVGANATNLRVDKVPYVTNGVCEVHPTYHPIGCIISRSSVGLGDAYLVPSAKRSWILVVGWL